MTVAWVSFKNYLPSLANSYTMMARRRSLCLGAASSDHTLVGGPVTTKLCKVAIDRRGDRCRRISVGFPTTRLSEPRSQPFGHAWRADDCRRSHLSQMRESPGYFARATRIRADVEQHVASVRISRPRVRHR